ncbi:uncharacterized protein LOC127535264 [Acanthochromis polyacanthus]|uniref:uncharacterized protein LOC127535264 n=1 Tax=Acanthochromis polyacanthus TaxID=80966 RepID=UPI00223485BE|nr:uncharacterized protein LOC127535264 [Acanthochromis polyacanthus]
MQTTFSLRRREIVQEDPPVKDIMERWPALQMEAQVYAEFHRLTNINLRNQFHSELDRHIPRLLAIYRQKAGRTGKVSEALRNILQLYDQQIPDIDIKRTTALWALSAYLCEGDPDFYKTWNAEERDEPDITDTPVALVMTVTESTSEMVPFTPDSFSIAVEDSMMMMSIPTFADAFTLIFGLMYALHLAYPCKLTNTFTFIQKVVMGLDDGKPLKPRLLGLKNDLLQ